MMKIVPGKIEKTFVYHDPCELGRGSEIYESPRELIKNLAHLVVAKQEKENSLCCGGCLGDLNITENSRKMISEDVIKNLVVNSPDAIVTSCPLCKKTLNKATGVEVLDIAEVVNSSIKN